MEGDQFIRLVEASQQNNVFYHFTDKRNLPLIKANGLLSMAELRRRGISVPAPGGNEWSLDADIHSGMDEYVHLTFLSGHPMEYYAKKEGRIEELFHLQVQPAVLKLPGVVATNDVANKSGVVPMAVPDFLDAFDLKVVYTRTVWSDPAVKARLQAARKCELLVPNVVPTEFILNLP